MKQFECFLGIFLCLDHRSSRFAVIWFAPLPPPQKKSLLEDSIWFEKNQKDMQLQGPQEISQRRRGKDRGT